MRIGKMGEGEHPASARREGGPAETAGSPDYGEPKRRFKALRRLPMRAYLTFSLLRRGMTLGVRAVIFDTEGRVLLVRHSYVAGWHFPGGGVEPGETTEAALRREVEEEAAVRLGPSPPALFGLYRNRITGRDHVAVYICRDWTPHGTFAPNGEIVACAFHDPARPPRDISPATARRLAEIAGDRPVSADW
jgi:8-oxo-dGTP pyrophosphatase MutT (NUDIX family)